MDSPTFNAGHSTPDPQDGEPAANPDRMPAGVLTRPVLAAPHAAPVAGPARAAEPPATAFGVDIETLVTEDDTPADNMPSEKQQRLRDPQAAAVRGVGVGYYVIHDPLHQVMDDELRVYRLRAGSYEQQQSPWFPELRLRLILWDGVFEAVRHRWLRWTDEHGAPNAWQPCCCGRASTPSRVSTPTQ